MKQEQALQSFQSHFEAYEKALNGASDSPQHLRRKAAMQQLTETGFPTLRHEDWRYTNLNPILATEFAAATAANAEMLRSVDAKGFVPDLQYAALLVFVDGEFVKTLSNLSALPPGLAVSDLASALTEDDGLLGNQPAGIDDTDVQRFTVLNNAFAHEGAVIRAAAGHTINQPVHLLFLSSGRAKPVILHPRIIIHAEKGSEFSVIEQYAALNDGVHFTNAVVECRVEENAHVHHYKTQNESRDAFHVSTSYARVARNASYSNHYFGLGGKLTRNSIHAVLDGESAECTMNGLFLPQDAQHMDHHTLIDHAKPRCSSHELYKGLLRDASRGVFSGKIIVRKDAQQTDARQSSNNLLLSENAQIDTKPQLEIWADDVKCTHGATVGRMDEEALFYLRSRGIHRDEAQEILSQAFASEVVSRVSIDALRVHLESMIHNRLEASRKNA